MIFNIENTKLLLLNIKKDRISESAAQCAYYVILSFIPFIILLLTLIQYINIESEQIFEILSAIIPDNMQEMVFDVIREVYSKSIGTISISLIFTVISADRSLFALTKELHYIYRFNRKQNEINNIFKNIIDISNNNIYNIDNGWIINNGIWKSYNFNYKSALWWIITI